MTSDSNDKKETLDAKLGKELKELEGKKAHELKAQELVKALQELEGETQKKGHSPTSREIKDRARALGIELGSYCLSPYDDGNSLMAFWAGDEKPELPAEYVPLELLKITSNISLLPKEQARLRINAETGNKYLGYYFQVIAKWEELDLEAARGKLTAFGYEGVELLTYEERTQREKYEKNKQGEWAYVQEPSKREKQVLLFPNSYSEEKRSEVLAKLRGETKAEKTAQTIQPVQQQYFKTALQIPPAKEEPTQIYQPSKVPEPDATPQAASSVVKPSSIDELLPKGKLEETNLKLTVEVAYEGKPYKFTLPVLINELMAIDGETGYRLEGKSAITFTDERYVKDAVAREEVEKKLIAKDKRIRTRISGELQRTLEVAFEQNNLQQKQQLVKRALNYLNQ